MVSSSKKSFFNKFYRSINNFFDLAVENKSNNKTSDWNKPFRLKIKPQ